MQISYLINMLPKGSVLSSVLEDPQCDIAEAQLITEDQSASEPDVLYIGEPRAGCPPVANLAAGASADTRETQTVNRIILSEDCDERGFWQLVTDLLKEDRRDSVRGRQLTQAFLKGRGLQAFVEMSARILWNPLFVVDASCECIAKASPAPPSDPACAKLLDPGPLSSEFTAYLRKLTFRPSAGGDTGTVPTEHDCGMLHCRLLIYPISIHNMEIGFLIMPGTLTPIRSGDPKYFTLLADLIAQELQKDEIFQSFSGTGGYFLAGLLEETAPTRELIDHRMSFISFQPLDSFAIVVLDTPGRAMNRTDIRAVEWKLQRAFPDALHTSYNGQIILLLTFYGRDPGRPLPEEELEAVLKNSDILAGVSDCFTDLTLIRRYYGQAGAAVSLGGRYRSQAGENRIFQYRDCVFREMLELCSERMDPEEFCDPRLSVLAEHDRQFGTDYMATLDAYLNHLCSPQKAANALFIHKNTLLYRMSHILELTGLDLTDSNTRFMLMLSFRILSEMNNSAGLEPDSI
ncbi:MAG: helix-turn-helix domain-containing protein [Lachnospiraceae bacterium]|nr:helix-turn-helix domain-containing protein [Lachnospiraceae bacterium]